MSNVIAVRGARQHNLKNLSVDITEFKPNRFAEGPVVEETNVI